MDAAGEGLELGYSVQDVTELVYRSRYGIPNNTGSNRNQAKKSRN